MRISICNSIFHFYVYFSPKEKILLRIMYCIAAHSNIDVETARVGRKREKEKSDIRDYNKRLEERIYNFFSQN